MNIFESAFIDTTTGVEPNEMTTYDIHQEIKKIKKDSSSSKEILNRYIIEYNKKFALSFGALFFAFLALPVACIAFWKAEWCFCRTCNRRVDFCSLLVANLDFYALRL